MARSKKTAKKQAKKTTRRKAAIEPDDIGAKPLSQVTGEQLVNALKADGYTLRHLTYWPEKKKVEYWTQPETVRDLKVKDLLDIIRNEKKKLEYEVDPPIVVKPPGGVTPINEKKKREIELPDFVPGTGGQPGGLVNEKKKAERELPPGGLLSDDAVLDALAEKVAARMKR